MNKKKFTNDELCIFRFFRPCKITIYNFIILNFLSIDYNFMNCLIFLAVYNLRLSSSFSIFWISKWNPYDPFQLLVKEKFGVHLISKWGTEIFNRLHPVFFIIWSPHFENNQNSAYPNSSPDRVKNPKHKRIKPDEQKHEKFNQLTPAIMTKKSNQPYNLNGQKYLPIL